ncbi:MAG: hypothetical protein AB7I19_10595 [Planctomycetota bacterium]
MSTESQGGAQGTGTSPVMVEDVILTDAFLIKGRVAGKYNRLKKVLEDYERTFLVIEEATMISLRGNDVVRTPCVRVNTKEIILAHELVDMAGDEGQRALAHDDKPNRIRAFYSGGIQIEIAGRVSTQAYEASRATGQRWFTMREPVLRGLNLDGPNDLRLLKNLPYAIIQKQKLSYIYDFS